MAKKDTLWAITRATQAKHTILRKYLDAWLPSSALAGMRTSHLDALVLSRATDWTQAGMLLVGDRVARARRLGDRVATRPHRM